MKDPPLRKEDDLGYKYVYSTHERIYSHTVGRIDGQSGPLTESYMATLIAHCSTNKIFHLRAALESGPREESLISLGPPISAQH